jgi:hypothetical protein
MQLCPQHLFLAVQDKRVARSTGRTVLADDGECAVQDDKQQDFVSWDSLKRCVRGTVGCLGACRGEGQVVGGPVSRIGGVPPKLTQLTASAAEGSYWQQQA